MESQREANMKIGTFIAGLVPELRKMSGNQLLKVWGACSPYSRQTIYLHCVILLACSSVIFNVFMRLGDSLLLDLLGLLLGLLLPPNIYFLVVFHQRRAQIREFIQEHWEEYRPE